MDATYGLRVLWDCPKIVRRASTVRFRPKVATTTAIHRITPVLDDVTTCERILVIAGGTKGVSCWGDIIANAFKANGIRGTVIDGMSRDIDGSSTIRFPVYGRGANMISARERVV